MYVAHSMPRDTSACLQVVGNPQAQLMTVRKMPKHVYVRKCEYDIDSASARSE